MLIALGRVPAVLADRLPLVLLPSALALLITEVLAPVVDRPQRYGVPRVVSSLAVVLGLLALLVGAVVLLGRRVADELPRLRDQLAQATSRLDTLGMDVPVPGVLTPSPRGAAPVGAAPVGRRRWAEAPGVAASTFTASTFEALVAVLSGVRAGVPVPSRRRADVAVVPGQAGTGDDLPRAALSVAVHDPGYRPTSTLPTPPTRRHRARSDACGWWWRGAR